MLIYVCIYWQLIVSYVFSRRVVVPTVTELLSTNLLLLIFSKFVILITSQILRTPNRMFSSVPLSLFEPNLNAVNNYDRSLRRLAAARIAIGGFQAERLTLTEKILLSHLHPSMLKDVKSLQRGKVKNKSFRTFFISMKFYIGMICFLSSLYTVLLASRSRSRGFTRCFSSNDFTAIYPV